MLKKIMILFVVILAFAVNAPAETPIYGEDVTGGCPAAPAGDPPTIITGDYEVPSSGVSFYITVPETDWSKSVFFQTPSTRAWPQTCWFYVAPLDSTTVWIRRKVGDISAITVHWSIMTFPTGVKAIYNSIAAGASGTQAIGGTVDMAKSWTFLTGFSADGTSTQTPWVRTYSTTQIQWAHANARFLSWTLVEFE